LLISRVSVFRWAPSGPQIRTDMLGHTDEAAQC
jgi:hypothetical protein